MNLMKAKKHKSFESKTKQVWKLRIPKQPTRWLNIPHGAFLPLIWPRYAVLITVAKIIVKSILERIKENLECGCFCTVTFYMSLCLGDRRLRRKTVVKRIPDGKPEMLWKSPRPIDSIFTVPQEGSAWTPKPMLLNMFSAIYGTFPCTFSVDRRRLPHSGHLCFCSRMVETVKITNYSWVFFLIEKKT